MIIPKKGIAYQATKDRIQYTDEYIESCRKYKENPDRMSAILAGRNQIVREYVKEEVEVLDVGVGAMDFLESRDRTYGYDIVPETVSKLKKAGKYSDDFSRFRAFTLWDVLEHMEDPSRFLRRIPDRSFVFVAIPTFHEPSFTGIESWPHYKPGEHLYYFTELGLIEFFRMNGFQLLCTNNSEIEAGRRDITLAAFIKDAPSYNDMIGMYEEMHQKRYGVTAADHLEQIAGLVRANKPNSIIDYGCGQAGFGNYFWRDGERRIYLYDPAIPQYKDFPTGSAFDLALCCDVMEHIEMRHVDRVLEEIRSVSRNAIFTIATKPARAKLPDGRNAHVTLLSPEEWREWIEDVFGFAEMEPTVHPKTVLVRTFKP